MKKLKYSIFAFILACSTLLMTACSLFGPSIDKFEVEFTANLQFLVGEEWTDSVKGTATYSDDSKKDVTNDMEIDTSAYDKTKVGKYNIVFSYEGISVDYEVEVVDKITNSALINHRLSGVVSETFKRNDNALSFEATRTTDLSGADFVESLVYVENNGQISAYTKWTLDNETCLEMHYNGTKDSGLETCIIGSGNIQEYENWSLKKYSEHLLLTAEMLEYPADITPYGILSLETDSFEGELTLNNEVYTLTHDGNTLQYKNNVITNLNGAELKFPKDTQTTIPTFTSIQDYMDIVIENTYVRADGQLEILADYIIELQDGVEIQHEIVIQENNGEYLIYNALTIVGIPDEVVMEFWFDGTLENGTCTMMLSDEVICGEDVSIEDYSACIYAMQESFNNSGLDFELAFYPSNLIYLETSEFHGKLEITEEGSGLLKQEISDGVEFTLRFVDNEIVEVNDVTVIFNDTIHSSYIPEIPTPTE